ncbi:MAG: DUF2080 family transposase-associated protein [Deltaproteobacteria bacterium]|jgi:putative transposon-encoded protein|nr:DUF2080 family transposase-associated protein [Deltaproteobacteria bacterium]
MLARDGRRRSKESLKFGTGERQNNVPTDKNQNGNQSTEAQKEPIGDTLNNKVKFEIYGEEMIEKRVKSSGNSGRVYLPPHWVGHKVKIIRTD